MPLQSQEWLLNQNSMFQFLLYYHQPSWDLEIRYHKGVNHFQFLLEFLFSNATLTQNFTWFTP